MARGLLCAILGFWGVQKLFLAISKIIRNFAEKLAMNTQIFEQIRQLKRQIMPNEKVILFGSQARGDDKPDSDWDLLILLNKPKEELSDFENFAYPYIETGWNFDVSINPKLYTQKEWEQGKVFPFYQNVMREGIEIK